MAVDGILNLMKPPGMTSHDAVAAIRRLFGERRVGHAGTLDPDAAGVLVVCLGAATKTIQFMADDQKEYCAVAVLGFRTDTLDAGGKLVESARPGWATSLAHLGAAARSLTGEIAQIPPMVSAVHHEGKRLYELARAGVEVERTPRQVAIHHLEVEVLGGMPQEPLVAGARLRLFIRCSKGTYVRSLVDDLGREVGAGAYLEFLVRTGSGAFSIADSVTFEQLSEASMDRRLGYLAPAEKALARLPAIRLEAPYDEGFRNGRSVDASASKAYDNRPEAELVRVYGSSGRFLGVGRVHEGVLRATRVFA